MAEVTIITNNHWNNFLYGYELPEKVKNDFDWIDIDEIEGHSFIKYRNCYYSLSDFMSFHNTVHYGQAPVKGDFGYGWDGYKGDSFFSGVIIKVSDCGDMYKIGTYLS